MSSSIGIPFLLSVVFVSIITQTILIYCIHEDVRKIRVKMGKKKGETNETV